MVAPMNHTPISTVAHRPTFAVFSPGVRQLASNRVFGDLLHTESCQRVQLGGTAAGNITSHQRDKDQDKCDGSDCSRVHWLDAVKLIGDKASGAVGSADTDGEANSDHEKTLTQNKTKNVRFLCAQRCPLERTRTYVRIAHLMLDFVAGAARDHDSETLCR